jgi:Arc/MetJ family transcription regulator
MELADFGAVEFRARTMIEIDYEPVALAVKEAQLAKERQTELAAYRERAKVDGSAVQPLGSPSVIGTKPWLSDVPMKREIVENFPMPPDLLLLLHGDPWNTGRGSFQHPEDDRQRGLFVHIEYRFLIGGLEADALSSAVEEPAIMPTGLPGRPSKGRDAILGEFRRRIENGDEIGTKAAEARKLVGWFKKSHPNSDQPTEKTVREAISEIWRQAKNAAENTTGNPTKN